MEISRWIYTYFLRELIDSGGSMYGNVELIVGINIDIGVDWQSGKCVAYKGRA